MSNTFDRLIAVCQGQRASDVHFSVGQQPICRINGDLVRLEKLGHLNNDDIKNFIRSSVPVDKYPEFEKNKQLDYAYETGDGIRLRCSVEEFNPSEGYTHTIYRSAFA